MGLVWICYPGNGMSVRSSPGWFQRKMRNNVGFWVNLVGGCQCRGWLVTTSPVNFAPRSPLPLFLPGSQLHTSIHSDKQHKHKGEDLQGDDQPREKDLQRAGKAFSGICILIFKTIKNTALKYFLSPFNKVK